VFQAFVNEVFWDMPGHQVVVYIDDILIYSANLDDHVAHIQDVLERLLENHRCIKAEKCQFILGISDQPAGFWRRGRSMQSGHGQSQPP
jgi:hypothetical protein